jgi:hypothetical protein
MKNIMVQLAAVLLIILSSCKRQSDNKITDSEDKELQELFALIQGSFNSELQSKTDSSYFNISLHMYPIWEEKGHFLYVEQAVNSTQDQPYRQRIYEVKRQSDSTFSSAIYTILQDSLWIGKWKTPKAFDSLSTEGVSLKSGCEVILKRKGPNHFVGKTGDTTCISNLRGASYATSEVEILSNKIISWDRGFDSNGNQVWGAKGGGYIFNKLN